MTRRATAGRWRRGWEGGRKSRFIAVAGLAVVMLASGTARARDAEDGAKAVRDTEDAQQPGEPSVVVPRRPSIDQDCPPGCQECPEPVLVTRWFPGGAIERRWLTLVTCEGEPNPDALGELSLIARPADVPRPDEGDATDPASAFVAPGIIRLHPGLLRRLQALASRFPGHRLVVVSGYRPDARPGSRHRHGRALDIKIGGTSRAEVSASARDLPDTGVGYYPNSVFTHIDVRERSAYWIDRSRPGEPPDYGPWPDPDWPGHGQHPADGSEGIGIAAATPANAAGDDRRHRGNALANRSENAPSAEGHDDALEEILAQIRHGLLVDEPMEMALEERAEGEAGDAVEPVMATFDDERAATVPEPASTPAPVVAAEAPALVGPPGPPSAPENGTEPPLASYTGGTVLIAE